MPVRASPRFFFFLITASVLFGITFVGLFRRQNIGTRSPDHDIVMAGGNAGSYLHGAGIMPKLGNETAKAELGRATWKYFHTVLARFPEKPAPTEKVMLKDYIHLFQRLYPCGECADHFGEIIKQYPPQVSSRTAAATWGCAVHNEVNKSLNKELFDCANIGDFYDCGCADDEKKAAATAIAATTKGGSAAGNNGAHPE